MNERVIEAAEEQIAETLWRNGIATSDLDMLHEAAESAVTAAMVALAPDIRAAVDDLVRKAIAFERADRLLDQTGLGGEMGYEDARDDLWCTKAAIFKLLGIPEGGDA